ncbi:MAG: HAMP domain-containing histidine kinase [Parcubacteria group bacterium]|nr:HAMP domain-containing histidine kinase [Parcubacteria group bacterium]
MEKANARLKELDQRKSEFLSLASHQLRTPLTAIKGYASMLLEGSFGAVADTQKKPLDTIFQSSERLVQIIEDFLTISRIEQNRIIYSFDAVDLAPLLEGLVNDLSHEARKKNIMLSFSMDEGASCVVRADKGKIQQVLSNVIDNAIKYTPEGSIRVSCGKAGSGVARVVVRDTGVGMDEATKEKIFGKFTRADDAGKVNTGGTGLGLYVARQLVEAHKGRIWAESEGKGKGSTFYIELPLVRNTPPAAKKVGAQGR